MKKQLSLVRLVKFLYLRLIRLRGDPQTLARSFAFGVFVGIIPLMPIQTLLLIPLTMALGLNTFVALIAAGLVSNPLTFIPQYYLCWWTGNLLLPGLVPWEQLKETLLRIHQQSLIDALYSITHQGFKTMVVLLSGGFILGLLAALPSYALSFVLIRKFREMRARKHLMD